MKFVFMTSIALMIPLTGQRPLGHLINNVSNVSKYGHCLYVIAESQTFSVTCGAVE